MFNRGTDVALTGNKIMSNMSNSKTFGEILNEQYNFIPLKSTYVKSFNLGEFIEDIAKAMDNLEVNFESEEHKMDFVIDLANGYKKVQQQKKKRQQQHKPK